MPAQAVKAKADEPEKLEALLEGFQDGLAWAVYDFRDIKYRVTELPIGEYDDIVKKATVKERVEDPDTGNVRDVETLDQRMQSRLMLIACVKREDGEKLDVTKLGTRLTIALNGAVNRLHYGVEPDALRPVKKDGEDEAKGNR